MATAEVASRPQEDRPRRKPFAQWVKNLASLKNKDKDNNSKKSGIPLTGTKNKKSQTQNGTLKNNPYPKSGHHLQQRDHSPASSANGHLSFSLPHHGNGSYDSLPVSTTHGQEERSMQENGNRSGAPTLATTTSDAGRSKAPTTTTHGGALSSIDGAGADSTFSSPNQSQHSLTTTLTTIQSSHLTPNGSNAQQSGSGNAHPHHHGSLNNPNPPDMFSHQYPVSPAPSGSERISAIPRHVADTLPNTYNSATANNLLTDNASILTLASSSKRRRRSMDTDASVRALAPSSVWGGSRESLPLSVLSGNADPIGTQYTSGAGHGRPSIGGLASAERASVYSNPGMSLASERNSYMSHRPGKADKDYGDAKSLRSIHFRDARDADSRSLGGDVGSLRGGDVGSVRGGDVASLRGSVRSGGVGHGRNDSLPGSIGSPLAGRVSAGGAGGLRRRSSDWKELDGEAVDDEEDRGDGEVEYHEQDGGVQNAVKRTNTE